MDGRCTPGEKRFRVDFKEQEGEISDFVEYKEITWHLVFDVKLGDNFRHKARFCVARHIRSDSASVELQIGSLNGLYFKGVDIHNNF